MTQPEAGLWSRMTEYLPVEALELIGQAAAVAKAKRKSVYLVGGVVRDLLLGRTRLDIDLVLEGDAVSLARAVATDRDKLTVHPSFGTATIKGEHFNLDFATARRETYLRPGALPTVQPSNINDDLYRRDFTINAMAILLTGRRRGELIDPWGGQSDLEKGLVRVLHDKSFIDDATRILRAIRYEQRLNFHIEPNTEFLLRHDAPMLETISGDRLRHEMDRLFGEEYPERALHRADELGIWASLHPSLRENWWLAGSFHRARATVRPTPASLCFALFLYRSNRDQASEALNRLSAPKSTTKTVLDTIALRDELESLASPDTRPSRLYDALRDYSPQAVMANCIAHEGETVCRNLSLYLNRLRYIRPSLRGDDLIAMGAEPGPGVGEMLSRLHQAKLDGEVTTKADEVRLVRRLLCSQPAIEDHNISRRSNT